jgi:hypothetical protein
MKKKSQKKPKTWIQLPGKKDTRLSWDFRHCFSLRKMVYWKNVAVLYLIGPFEIYVKGSE